MCECMCVCVCVCVCVCTSPSIYIILVTHQLLFIPAARTHESYISLSDTEITRLQTVFTPGNECRLNKSQINCCNYSPAHPYNNYYTLDRGSSPLLAQITSQTHANHHSLLTISIYYTCCNYSWLFFFNC